MCDIITGCNSSVHLRYFPEDSPSDKTLAKKMTLKAEFEQYAENVKKVKTRPTDQELLDLYGLYKQAIAGDINIDKSVYTDAKGKAKWDAWNSRKGMSNEDAMTAYNSLAKETIEKYGM